MEDGKGGAVSKPESHEVQESRETHNEMSTLCEMNVSLYYDQETDKLVA